MAPCIRHCGREAEYDELCLIHHEADEEARRERIDRNRELLHAIDPEHHD